MKDTVHLCVLCEDGSMRIFILPNMEALEKYGLIDDDMREGEDYWIAGEVCTLVITEEYDVDENLPEGPKRGLRHDP